MNMERIRQMILSSRKWLDSGTHWRFMATKAGNRAAVHGVKEPVPGTVDKEEVEKDIQKGREREAKRKQIEKAVESQIKNNSTKSD